MCLTTPGSFISAIRNSGSPAEGSTNKVNSGLELKDNNMILDTEKGSTANNEKKISNFVL